ncbi:hypothetical protein DFQ12_2808 [Sphingobacterium detergens]|uniref:Uncharacterized protein n=1 Tax=Sphingobacterium detergens TaxID=1145106 RepID=A0A420B780_SPHD1|nr:hypothetical protein DFQ12_2808 [Sphingobacterium detergens]
MTNTNLPTNKKIKIDIRKAIITFDGFFDLLSSQTCQLKSNPLPPRSAGIGNKQNCLVSWSLYKLDL